jgi:D-tyrosyl-tRNA(Tyr) deacylase
MRAVIQRVRSGKVTVEGMQVASIGHGLVILLGIGPTDSSEIARQFAEKIARLRIFEDAQGKMNLSVQDVKGSAIVVSQFTLYADAARGNRPSFTDAAKPEIARPLCDCFVKFLTQAGVPTQTGEFGAHMQVEIINDGPVTIWLEA